MGGGQEIILKDHCWFHIPCNRLRRLKRDELAVSGTIRVARAGWRYITLLYVYLDKTRIDKMTLTNVIIFGVGAILIYASIKNKSPIDVVKGTLNVSATATPPVAGTVQDNITPMTSIPVYPSN